MHGAGSRLLFTSRAICGYLRWAFKTGSFSQKTRRKASSARAILHRMASGIKDHIGHFETDLGLYISIRLWIVLTTVVHFQFGLTVVS